MFRYAFRIVNVKRVITSGNDISGLTAGTVAHHMTKLTNRQMDGRVPRRLFRAIIIVCREICLHFVMPSAGARCSLPLHFLT